jgi:hypothetical protein
MDRREHHRVQLRIPARLRWTTPFGQMTEQCETLNVSRGGLLVPCKENHAAGISLWVTFPFDASLPFGQPEILARVVRSSPAAHTVLLADGREAVRASDADEKPSAEYGASNGSRCYPDTYAAAAALRFDVKPHHATNGNGHRELERRTSPRRALAVPIRVRPELVPWFEETMTLDISREGLRFLSSREYEAGQHLLVSFDEPAASPWPNGGELRCLVVRVDPLAQTPALGVTIYRVE